MPRLTPWTALDLVGPYHFLGATPGVTVHLVTNQADMRPVKSDIGLAIQPTTTLADCPKDVTVLFTPGETNGTVAVARDPATVAFLRDRAERARYVTSGCVNGNQGRNYAIVDPPDEGRERSLIRKKGKQSWRESTEQCK